MGIGELGSLLSLETVGDEIEEDKSNDKICLLMIGKGLTFLVSIDMGSEIRKRINKHTLK